MDNRIPIKLKKEPLIEAIWEVRFSSVRSSIADLLPGILFKSFPDIYSNIVRLPTANIPALVVEHDPNLRYVPKIRLENGNQAVQIGEHVVSLHCRRPYSGWVTFSSDIRDLAAILQETDLIGTPERFSLKYIDLIDLDEPPGLDCLNLDLRLGKHEINTKPVQIRTEIKEKDFVHIIQIISPAEVNIPGDEKSLQGVLLDIDTIKTFDGKEFWRDFNNSLNDMHISCKRTFFSLIKTETLNKLGPEYEG